MVRVEDSVVMNFRTDALGFRRFKEVVGQYQRWFVYDMGSSEVPGLAPLVAEYDESGNLVAKYHYDGGGLLAMTRNNESYWYGFEGIGTVRQLMGSQGQVVDAYAFDAWGNELISPQSQVQNPFKYVGKHGYYSDTESALMLLGMRYYSAANGLFLSRDLIEGYGYSYAADNPARWMDPQGLQFEEPNNQTCSIVNGERVCASPTETDKNFQECPVIGGIKGNGSKLMLLPSAVDPHDPPCVIDWRQYPKDVIKAICKCIRQINFKECVKKELGKKFNDSVEDLICYIIACWQYGGRDPCKDPAKNYISQDCQACSHFQLSQCLCKAKKLPDYTVCYAKHQKRMQKCLCMTEVE